MGSKALLRFAQRGSPLGLALFRVPRVGHQSGSESLNT